MIRVCKLNQVMSSSIQGWLGGADFNHAWSPYVSLVNKERPFDEVTTVRFQHGGTFTIVYLSQGKSKEQELSCLSCLSFLFCTVAAAQNRPSTLIVEFKPYEVPPIVLISSSKLVVTPEAHQRSCWKAFCWRSLRPKARQGSPLSS